VKRHLRHAYTAEEIDKRVKKVEKRMMIASDRATRKSTQKMGWQEKAH
jgi:hypothetical protein